MKIALGSDHAGYNLKEALKEKLAAGGHQVDDKGTYSLDSTDYPEQAAKVAKAVADGEAESGVLVCGSGIGMSITANRFHGVRAVLAPSLEHAKLGRQHNNANVLCLGERLTPQDLVFEILDAFLATEFEGGRHIRRIDKIESLSGAGS
ncbi:ribose 5-phosphate isomerase B [Dethiosulfatarculus sandiegensis]|uniref:Ribose 5-phosphate isomerase n=1 Tax=Dethiosulfatarculus sandiegensis TaxID=1429043 RepID=A0A0D2J6S5_9BACT|nr:ribose 5-phosphate isomerase B [Dethiosulfatarculus sandiegensis]KIX11381.1 ribose 5-phosphate isomerase [Dethiosulfatarculus sandiegensis]